MSVVIADAVLATPQPGCTLKELFDNSCERLFRGQSSLQESHKPDFEGYSVVDKNGNVIYNLPQWNSTFGRVDIAQYHLPSQITDIVSLIQQYVICAGLEVLQRAGFHVLSNKEIVPLKAEFRKDTGIVFASSFVTESTTLKLKSKIPRKLMLQWLVTPNAQLAQLVKAQGPNMEVHAACASTTLAIATAQDWIQTGRCKRVIVLAGDDPCEKSLVPYTSGSFVAMGAGSISKSSPRAFDRDRSGLHLGAGVLAMLIENADSLWQRKPHIQSIVELKRVMFLNAGYHATALDQKQMKVLWDTFLESLEQDYGISKEFLAERMLYYSHETGTPGKNGCGASEMEVLKQVFPEELESILVTATKQYTGHTMGCGIEDVMCFWSLINNRAPPIYTQNIDSDFEKLLFSRGGIHKRQFAMRFSAGFGSHLALSLYEKRSLGPSLDSSLGSPLDSSLDSSLGSSLGSPLDSSLGSSLDSPIAETVPIQAKMCTIM